MLSATGVFYIRQLPLSLNSNAQHLFQLQEVRSFKIIAQEVHSDVVDHSEWGSFEDCKLEEDSYVYHYYYAVLDVYVLPFLATEGPNPNHTGLDKAINSCIQPDSGCSHDYFALDLDKFPSGAKRFLRCFVCLVPPPIPSPVPIRFTLHQTPHSWMVGRSGEVLMRFIDLSGWVDAMVKRIHHNRGAIMEYICVSYWTEDIINDKWGRYSWGETYWIHDHGVPAGTLYSLSAARPADSDIWYSLSVRLTGTTASLPQRMDDLQRLGVLASRGVRDRTVKKSAPGWDGSDRTLSLLFKVPRIREWVKKFVKTEYNGAVVTERDMNDYAPSGYIGVCELGYLSELFSQGFDQSVLDILLSRGPDPLVPEGHIPTKDEGKRLFLRMCSRDLFEYSHFPISTTMLLAAVGGILVRCKTCLQ